MFFELLAALVVLAFARQEFRDFHENHQYPLIFRGLGLKTGIRQGSELFRIVRGLSQEALVTVQTRFQASSRPSEVGFG